VSMDDAKALLETRAGTGSAPRRRAAKKATGRAPRKSKGRAAAGA
jgi:hypothetical protein